LNALEESTSYPQGQSADSDHAKKK
jgi:hypothetical protein